MTQTLGLSELPRTNAILLPSGDQEGSPSLGPSVRRRWSLPSEFMTYMDSVSKPQHSSKPPSRPLTKAISSASVEKVGS